jgi:hypothetical protein
MYGIYNSICSLATTTAAIIGLTVAFVRLPQLRFEEGYDSGEGLLPDLLHRSMMMIR